VNEEIIMSKLTVKAIPLTREAFAPYGDVIEMEGAQHFPINEGNVERYHDLASVMIDVENGSKPIISIFRANGVSPTPTQVRLVERHPRGSQAFIPMHEDPIVVVVARAGDEVEPSNLRAFVTNGLQGVNYHTGVWHMPLVTSVVGPLALIVDRNGPGDNCDELYFEGQQIFVDVP
jgi:ureidoglycolate lyase